MPGGSFGGGCGDDGAHRCDVWAVLLAALEPLMDHGGVPTKAVERVRRRVDRESGGRHGGTDCCVLRKKVREIMACMRQLPRSPEIQIKPAKTDQRQI